MLQSCGRQSARQEPSSKDGVAASLVSPWKKSHPWSNDRSLAHPTRAGPSWSAVFGRAIVGAGAC
ncbi:hypothetical protein [Streptomyces mirabilis]|uniref:hypothetical protein n=1 Tax=Streptomyces mirabilis TaxID=68239 RepID=UPI00372056E9